MICTQGNDLQNYYKSNAGTEFITKYEKVSKDINGCLENLQNLLTGLKMLQEYLSLQQARTMLMLISSATLRYL